MPTAVVIDGAYFLRRFKHSFAKLDSNDAQQVASGLLRLVVFHLMKRVDTSPVWANSNRAETKHFRPHETSELYRIFFYDCAPLSKKMHLPVSKRAIDLSKSKEAILRNEIHRRLRKVRKVALRLGSLNQGLSTWKPRPEATKRWLADPENFAPVDDDFQIDVVQKGVDMRLGLDIASMAFKRQVDQIILVAGDADFIPVAKLARREGIDVVLDPMNGNVSEELAEHVDGIRHFEEF
jgi:uncharacterized LabA/DUF88 family protein